MNKEKAYHHENKESSNRKLDTRRKETVMGISGEEEDEKHKKLEVRSKSVE